MAAKTSKTQSAVVSSIVDQLSAPKKQSLFPPRITAKDGSVWLGAEEIATLLGWNVWNAVKLMTQRAKQFNIVAKRVTAIDPKDGEEKPQWYATEESVVAYKASRDAYKATQGANGNGKVAVAKGKSIADQLAGL